MYKTHMFHHTGSAAHVTSHVTLHHAAHLHEMGSG
jgi:hypothetical protein